MIMRRTVLFAASAVIAALVLTACSRSTLGRFVGNGRDDHGCLSTMGYTWSNALHDCVRVWEVSERFDEGSKPVFLLYSRDSLYAEIFLPDGTSSLCRRVKETNRWEAIEGKEAVFISNGITTIKGNTFTYTKKVAH